MHQRRSELEPAENAGLTNLNVQTVLIDPRNPDTVYAGTYDGGVFAMTFPSEP